MATAIRQCERRQSGIECRWLDANDPQDRSRWLHELRGLQHDVYHLIDYVRLDAATVNADPVAFVATEGERKMFVPLIVRDVPNLRRGIQWNYRDATSPYGFPCPVVRYAPQDTPQQRRTFVERSIEHFKHELRGRDIVAAFLRFHPLLSSDSEHFNERGRVVQHGHSVYCDLTVSEAEMWKQTRRRDRSYINRTKRDDFCVVHDHEWRRLDDFILLYEQTMRRVAASDFYFFPRNYFESIRDTLGTHAGLVLVVSPANEVACGGIFTQCDSIIQYHLGGTATAFRNQQPAKFLIDQVRRWGKASGFRYLNLGGGVGSSGDSLFHFKSGFSKLRAPFASCRLVSNAVAYAQLVKAWESIGNRTADAIDGYFPAYRKPNTTLRVVDKSGIVRFPDLYPSEPTTKTSTKVSSEKKRAA